MLIAANNRNVFDTDDAERFDEQLFWNGYAMVGKFSHMTNENCRQIMYSVENNYYLVLMTPDNIVHFANALSPKNAATWLISNSHPLPGNLPNPLLDQGK